MSLLHLFLPDVYLVTHVVPLNQIGGRDRCPDYERRKRKAVTRTQFRAARIPEGLELAARAASPELAGLEWSTLVRAGLARLAGHTIPDAITLARLQPGRRPGRHQPGATRGGRT
jgi:hypothetical protein